MITLSIRTLVRNAAAVFSGSYGAVTRQAEQAGGSRQTVYDHARRGEQRSQSPAPTEAPSPPTASLDEPTRRRLAVTASAMGLSTRQIEDRSRVILGDDAPDHATIGRRVKDEAVEAKPVLEALDAAAAPRVRALAPDEIFLTLLADPDSLRGPEWRGLTGKSPERSPRPDPDTEIAINPRASRNLRRTPVGMGEKCRSFWGRPTLVGIEPTSMAAAFCRNAPGRRADTWAERLTPFERRVAAVLEGTVRASSAVGCMSSVLRMQQARRRRMTQPRLDLERRPWNYRRVRSGPREGTCP